MVGGECREIVDAVKGYPMELVWKAKNPLWCGREEVGEIGSGFYRQVAICD